MYNIYVQAPVGEQVHLRFQWNSAANGNYELLTTQHVTMVLFEKGAWVWLQHETSAWIPVQMVEVNAESVIVESAEKERFSIPLKAPQPPIVLPSSFKPTENMEQMEELSEAGSRF